MRVSLQTSNIVAGAEEIEVPWKGSVECSCGCVLGSWVSNEANLP